MSDQPHDICSKTQANTQQVLRQQAEKRLESLGASEPTALTPDELRALLHELHVHQIELEMQNEELRHTQESLLAAQARYFDLYDLAPVGYLTLSQHSIILEANLTAARMLGAARARLSGQPFTHWILASDQDIYYQFHKALAGTGAAQQCELRQKRGDDSTFWVKLDAVPALDEKIGTLVYRVTLSDITALKQAEETQAELQQQLAQVQKMELVGRLAGGIAHEFNNMLAVILLRTEMSLPQIDPDAALHRNLKAIYTTAKRAAELVHQLLGFARKQMIAPSVLDLNVTIEGMLPMLRQLVGEEIELIWQPAAFLWLIKMDSAQIDEVLVNLCLNARDAIDGVGAITIKTENILAEQTTGNDGFMLPPGSYVMLTVSDNGCGMAKEVLDHIFEPFFTTKEVGKGTGLGLPMVEGVVRQNEGHIQVSSKPGRGTTFQIYLPRLVGVESAPVTVESQPLSRGDGETILLVEDDVAVLNMATDVLEYLGYTVIGAVTPGEALRQAESHSGAIDLLITDIVMPGMNGRDLANRIATLRPGVRQLFVSGYPADYVVERGVLEAQMHFLEKPYSLSALASKARNALDSPVVWRRPG